MMPTLKVHLKRGDRVFVNGAVLQSDRKVTLEFLNNVDFLLGTHVLQEEEAVTPLRQLYFVIQSQLIEPKTAEFARVLYEDSYRRLIAAVDHPEIRAGLVNVDALVEKGRLYEAMKRVRELFHIEDGIVGTAEKAAVAAQG